MAIVDIIGFRHGETDGNLNNILQGCSVDYDLNDNGRSQAGNLALELNPLVADYDGIIMISSDLLRAQNTGLKVYNSLPRDKKRGFSTHLELRERNYGSFEGRHKHLVRETVGSKQYWELTTVRERLHVAIANDVETDHDLLTRVRNLINTVIQLREHISEREVLLVSSHGNTLRTILTAIFDNADYPPLSNCAHVKFSVEAWKRMIYES